MNPKDIYFSSNWNNKLDCKCFTTIRLANKHKYQIGYYFNVFLNGQPHKKAIIKDIWVIHLSQLDKFTAMLDTGYSLEKTKGILFKIYPGVDWKTQHIYVILFETFDWSSTALQEKVNKESSYKQVINNQLNLI